MFDRERKLIVIMLGFCYAFVRVCILMPCDQLLGKGWPFSLNIFYSINTNDIKHTFIVNIQMIRTKAQMLIEFFSCGE